MAKESHMADVSFRELTEYILNSYLDATSEEDMVILELLDENMSVIGTGKQEFFKNLQDFSEAFVFEVEQREKVQFRWQDFEMEEQRIDDDHMLVYGSVLILGSFPGGGTCIRMDSRYTILYGFADGIWKVLHIHHSVPDKEQLQNEEFPRTLGRQIEESQHMIMALASDYVVVYMIEPEADRAGIVKIDETIAAKSGDIPETFCYSKMFYTYAESRICKEDRDNFLQVVLPDALCNTFRSGRERFELNYRIWKDGRRIHYSGLFVRISKPGEPLKLIAGFRDTEDIVSIQKMAREKDKKLEEMHEILATSRMATWSIILPDGKAPRLEADDLMLELLGIADRNMTPEEVYDVWFSNIVPASRQSVVNSVEKMKKRGSDENTYLWKHPVLGERYVRCGGTAKPVEGGFVLRGYHYDVDDVVREQKKKDEELAEQLAIINALSQSFRNVFVANLEDGTARAIRLANSYNVRAIRDVAEIIFPFDDVVDRWVRETVHPDDKERIKNTINMENLRKIFSEQKQYVGTYRNIEDGVQHYYQYDFRRVGDTENIVAGFQLIDTIVEEQTAQEKKEKELIEAHLREVKEHSEVISSLSTIYSTIFIVDIDTHEYEILTSVPLMGEVAEARGNFDDVKDRIIESFMEPEFRTSMCEFLDINTLAERLKSVNTITTEYKAPTGQWLQARFIVKKRGGDGAAREALYVARDITKEKLHDLEQQEALTHALEATQQANKAKTTFLNSMSHDIRTPMNAIIGFTALAQTHSDDRTQVQDYLGKISTSSTHLLSLINDILDMSRIESGTVKLEETEVYLPELLQDLRTMTQSLVNAKNQTLVIDTQDVIHEEVLTDKLRLNQVLLNIVGNAIKFTQPGGAVSIRLVEKPCDRKNYATYEFSVKDNGIGMSKEYLGHIFETFSREYSATVSGIQGTGLGMAITKNIVDMMGGDIRVESEEGKGSLFTVILNLRPGREGVKNEPAPVLSDAKKKEKKQIYDYSGKRALLVEDNELNREIAAALLEKIGMLVDSVNDGDIAVSTINKAPSDKYDLIFMDIQMPKMDGYTATREIRTLPDNRKADIPIVAMTANAFEEDKRKSYEAGMNGHIIKPISIAAITKALDEIFMK